MNINIMSIIPTLVPMSRQTGVPNIAESNHLPLANFFLLSFRLSDHEAQSSSLYIIPNQRTLKVKCIKVFENSLLG